MIDGMVIFGATGDLTSRYLLPALGKLREAGKLPSSFQVIGIANQDWDTESFRRHVKDKMSENENLSSHDSIISTLEYRRADVNNRAEIARAVSSIKKPVVFYLALPPPLFEPAAAALSETDLPEGRRIVVEKPFGKDLASAENLNRILHESFAEGSVFRIDHFLHKQTVQNILGLRFANRIFEPLWNGHHIERVEIVWDEELALEGRSSYYDSTGALRDMIQNHLLQLLCLVAMEAPHSLDERNLRDRKVDVLRAVRKLSPEETDRRTLRGRYATGQMDGRKIPAYVDEKGVDPERETETFAQVELAVDNWRWSGVPFMLRSGKAMNKERKEIAVHFKPVPYLAFRQGPEPQPNVLRLDAVRDSMALEISINGPGDPFELERVELDTHLAPQDPDAYGRLLLGVLEGEASLSIRDDEAEESWRIVEPIANAWREGLVPLLEYPAGSGGPRAKDK